MKFNYSETFQSKSSTLKSSPTEDEIKRVIDNLGTELVKNFSESDEIKYVYYNVINKSEIILINLGIVISTDGFISEDLMKLICIIEDSKRNIQDKKIKIGFSISSTDYLEDTGPKSNRKNLSNAEILYPKDYDLSSYLKKVKRKEKTKKA